MISLNMLCNSVTAYKVTGLDEDRNATYSDGVSVSNVYFTYTDGQSNGSNGKEPSCRAVLYYDVYNSLPKNYRFSKGDKIEIDGLAFFVDDIAPYYSAAGLQHFVINLV